MTGEITLTGRVLPIGGLKEKALAAMRHGIKTIIIPYNNKKDLEDIPQEFRDELEFVPVKTLDEVLKIALVQKIVPISRKAGSGATSGATAEQKMTQKKGRKPLAASEPAVAKSARKAS